MEAQISSEWIFITATNEQELATAIQLAIDLRGQPKMWLANEEGVCFASQASGSVKAILTDFMVEPNASELASMTWYRIGSLDGIVVKIPRSPDQGGIGGWNALQLFMWQADVTCLITLIDVEQLEVSAS